MWSYVYFLIISVLPWIISLESREVSYAVDLIFMQKTQRSTFCDGMVYAMALGFFLAMPYSMWDLNFLMRDQILLPYTGTRILNDWTTREVLALLSCH